MNKLFTPSLTHNTHKTLGNRGTQQNRARRYMALCLPRLASDRILRKRWGVSWRLNVPHDHGGLIIVDHIRNGWRISHLDEIAQNRGLADGMSLADARAIHPDIEVAYGEAAADFVLLEAICDWCSRYTPLVALDQPDGMVLDITGCSHLFGGEMAMARDLLSRLFHMGFAASVAIATTPGAAWAASRFGGSKKAVKSAITAGKCNAHVAVMDAHPVIIKHGQEMQALALLPTAGLRLDAETLGGLARLGLGTIGQLMARARAPLARRFGRHLLLRLDQALGEVEEAISPRMPVPDLMCERRLAEPVHRVQDIEVLIERLATQLCLDMKQRQLGARHLELVLYRVDGKAERLAVHSAMALDEVDRICRILKERIAGQKNRLGDELEAGLGYETARLGVLQSEAVDPAQSHMHGTNNDAAQRANTLLLDNLGARLGRSRIVVAGPYASHLPERAEQSMAVLGTRFGARLDTGGTNRADAVQLSAYEDVNGPSALRPVRLLQFPEPVEAIARVPEGPPLRFRWRRKLHEILFAEGPERIGDEWWHRESTRLTRDYFRVEDRDGLRYWIYRQGLYGRESAQPKWFMHGFFA